MRSTSHPLQFDIEGVLIRVDTGESITTKGLLDCGATGSTISQSFVSHQKIPRQKLPNTITVTNADGTTNAHGQITHSTVVLLKIGEHVERKSFVIATLQHHDFYLEYDWLQQHNPSIDWTNFRIKFDRCLLNTSLMHWQGSTDL
jgi:Retroviral aspartyl protease